MKTFLKYLLISLLILGSKNIAFSQEAADCNNHFTGKDRAKVKNRSPRISGNQVIKKPITFKKWDSEMHYRDPLVPDIVSGTDAIPRLETTDVTVAGYLVGCKYEKGKGDQDIHCEIASTTNWNGPHIVVEIPAGNNFCQPRKEICSAWIADEEKSGDRHSGVQRIFSSPPKVLIRGVVFLDYHHTTKDVKQNHSFSMSNGGRGIRKDGQDSKVKGLWEIHPVVEAHIIQ